MKHRLFSFFLILLIAATPQALEASMTGGVYEIYADSIAVIDQIPVTSTDYELFGSGGEFFATSTSGGTITLRGGFQSLNQGTLGFTLSKTSISLGTVLQAVVSSDSLTTTVTTDSMSGYTLSASEDGNLRSGSNDINDVSDGDVTSGVEEYGIRSSGADALLSNDTAIGESTLVASSSGITTGRQTTVTFKASAGSQTKSGSYSHTVTFTVTVNP